MFPKISIVTPSFNQGQYLEETILSIVNQNYPNLEYIIIDGGSTDNSVEIIKKFKKHIKYWVSERDCGQSHAINKGIEQCTGNLFNWINSDDLLEPGALHTLADLYTQNPGYILYAGKLRTIDKENTIINDNLNTQSIRNGSFRNIPVRQQSNFFDLDYLNRLGRINEALHYTMDAELIFKILASENRNKIISTDSVLGCYRLQPESKGSTKIWDFVDELNIMYFHFAQLLGNKKLTSFFNAKIKNHSLQNNFIFPKQETDFKSLEKLLQYQLCNWVDYYYNCGQYDTAKSFISQINFSSLTLKDNFAYLKKKIQMLIS